MSPFRRFTIATTLAMLFAASPARASEPVRDGAGAQLFFEKGKSAAANGNQKEACRYFHESLRLDFAVGTLFNIAACEERLGELGNAWQHIHEGLDRLDERDPRRADALKFAAALEPRVPRLAVRLHGGDGTAFRDGVPLSPASLDTPVPVNPGLHVVKVVARGRRDATFEIRLGEGETKVVDVSPGAALVAAQQDKPASAVRTIAWGALATGGAALVVGGVTGAMAFGDSRVVRDHCDPNHVCDSDGMDALSRAKTFSTISEISLVAGGVLVASSVIVLFATKPSRAPDAAARSPFVWRF
mgnify:CR=1 FL=1